MSHTPTPNASQKKFIAKRFSAKRLAVVAVFIVLISGTVLSSVGFVAQPESFFEVTKNIELLGRIYREVSQNYVDELSVTNFMRAGIDGMLSTLDPYTVFMDEEQSDDIDQLTTGKYAGIGISLSAREGDAIVTSVNEGYSAAKAGMRVGDKIIKIDGKETRGKTTTYVRGLIKGEPKTEVKLTIEREGEREPLEFNLVRLEIILKNITYANLIDDSGVGYVDIQRFSLRVSEDLGSSLRTLQDSAKARGVKLQGVVLDLRDDPGGLLDVAVNVTDKFVEKGSTVVTTRGRDSSRVRSYISQQVPVMKDVPMAVLINGGSASASEIVAGAIQDLDRGVIVGTRSFGKGLVQTVTRLPYNTSLKITTAKYYTPSGRLIQEVNYFDRNKREGKRDVFSVMPDTMHKAFKTKNGRTVYDGGGITPDVIIGDRDLTALEEELYRKSFYFKFATRYQSRNPKLAGVFKADDKLFAEFKAYLAEQKFEYKSEAEKQLDALSETVTKNSYADAVASDIKRLQVSVRTEKDKDLERQKDRILNDLEQEIVSRYGGDSARLRASFKLDDQVREAVAILKDQKRYEKLLAAGTEVGDGKVIKKEVKKKKK
ncbi:MAG: S41 family peptidase [Rhizobacter sp.]|nr:S41 family peptidase [Chlorobiales bacterium]